MRGGKRNGAGRKKGVPNKVTAALRKKLNAAGIAPLEFMLQVMRDVHQDLAVRLETAKAAAPYLHPRLQAVEHTGEHEKNAQRFVVEFVAVPKRVDSDPPHRELPPRGTAQLTYGSNWPAGGRVIS
jgi:hypothetical protein